MTGQSRANAVSGNENTTAKAADSWRQLPKVDIKFAPSNTADCDNDKNKSGGANEAVKKAKSMGKDDGNKRSADQNWERVRKKLEAQLGKDVFDSWFGRLKLYSFEGGLVSLTVPTAFLKSWIQSKYRVKLLELWQEEDASVLRVDIAVRKPVAQGSFEESDASTASKDNGAQKGKTFKLGQSAPGITPNTTGPGRNIEYSNGFPGSPLDVKHTFDSFVEGSSNRMAYAAAQTIAEDISASHFNPLFIHANVGLGKTHLLQAIAWRARSRNPKARILYLTAEYFMWRFASAIRDKTALTLKESLRDIDILLIDDMQFLQGQAIQAEFCHLLNELIDSARQVVVAADRPPTELESLDERVRSRLKGGVTLEMKAPDYELRKHILNSRYQAARKEQPGLDIPEDILHYVARQVTSSGRDVEGAFNQLLVQHRFSEGNMSFEELDKILAHLIRSSDAKRVKIEDIQRIVARQFNVSRNDLLSNRRTRVIVRPRQIAMYLAKVMTPRSLPEIGRRFGGRDHTTVLHAVRKVEELSSNDQKIAHEIELLKRLILE